MRMTSVGSIAFDVDMLKRARPRHFKPIDSEETEIIITEAVYVGDARAVDSTPTVVARTSDPSASTVVKPTAPPPKPPRTHAHGYETVAKSDGVEVQTQTI